MIKKPQKILPTLILQPEGIYWIAYLEDEPNVRWTGKNAGDALGHYCDRVCFDNEITLKIVRKKNGNN